MPRQPPECNRGAAFIVSAAPKRVRKLAHDRMTEAASTVSTAPAAASERRARMQLLEKLRAWLRRDRPTPGQPEFPFDAFLSYSQAADSRFAPFLQGAVQRFARPWYRLRTVHIFRDATGLTLTPELWPDIERGLNASRTFILLASPEAAQSQWVRQEIAHWLALKRGLPLLVLTGGEIHWNRESNDFDWDRSAALPRLLAGVFASEPRYLDAKDLKADDLSPRHPKILTAAAEIYARLTNRPLDEVIGEDVRQHRRNWWMAALALAAIVAAGGGFLLQRAEANRQADIASARQQMEIARNAALLSLQSNGGPEALGVPERDAARAAMLAVESVKLIATTDGADALQAHLALAPKRTLSSAFGKGFTFAALSRDGRSAAAVSALSHELAVLVAGRVA